jgi:hypothetical protein
MELRKSRCPSPQSLIDRIATNRRAQVQCRQSRRAVAEAGSVGDQLGWNVSPGEVIAWFAADAGS